MREKRGKRRCVRRTEISIEHKDGIRETHKVAEPLKVVTYQQHPGSVGASVGFGNFVNELDTDASDVIFAYAKD